MIISIPVVCIAFFISVMLGMAICKVITKKNYELGIQDAKAEIIKIIGEVKGFEADLQKREDEIKTSILDEVFKLEKRLKI